jgi:pimeloyl-ACP methyl ester carboxylesterase
MPFVVHREALAGLSRGGQAEANRLSETVMNILLRAALLGSIMLVTGAASAAPARAPELRVEPYAFRLADGADLPAERGTFSVPEDRRDPRSRRIEIGFVRFRSTNPHPGAPIVYLAGGPGGSGVATARGPRQPIFLALRQVADVIALDQRGVGLSNHIPPCAAEHRLDPSAVLSEATLTAYYGETLRVCVARWRGAGVAVNGYTTEQSADDLEDLRRALGARRIDLWGISYGAHLAFAMMRRHPGSVGRVALASADGLSQRVKLPAHVDPVFGRIDRAIGGGLVERMRRVYARFDADPQAFTVPGQDGAGITFRADSFPLRMMAGIVPKNPDGIPQLAGAFAALDAGQTGPIAPLVWDYFYRNPLTMTGMPELIVLASGVSEARLAEVRRQAPASLMGMALNFPMPQLVGTVPGLDLGDNYRREIRSSIPTLLFSGDLDVRTPLEEQAEATARLRNLHRVLVRNGGHDLFEAHPDIPALLVDFFSRRRVTARELVLPRPSVAPPR